MDEYAVLYLFVCGAILMVWYLLNRAVAQSVAPERGHWKEASGQVVRINRGSEGAVYPIVGFVTGGASVRGCPEYLIGTGGQLKVGDTVPVLYDPDRPSQFLLKEDAVRPGRLGPVFFAGMVVLLVVLYAHTLNLL